MTKLFTTLLFSLFCFLSYSQLLITEISYNPPESGVDSLEYIEIYNKGEALDVNGYSMTGVDYTFSGFFAGGDYLIIAVNPTAFQNVFGISAQQFDGALSNGGETVEILDSDGNVVHSVDFDDNDPWPSSNEGTDGNGASIVLCDLDNPSLPESWKASSTATGVIINGNEVLGSPGTIEDAGCESGPEGIVVTTNGLAFEPQDITINVGETVTFVNGGGTHNANGSLDVYPANPVGFTSGPPSSDSWEYSFTFDVDGYYEYQCDLHVGAGMIGSITVLPVEINYELNITEVFYNSGATPDSLEFIEIYNNGTETVDIGGLFLTSSFIFNEIPSASIEPGGYFVLAKNENAFKEAFPGINNVVEWGDGTLSNTDDIITIITGDGESVVSVYYDDSAPWPTSADGFGTSLIACDPTAFFDENNVKASSYKSYMINDKEYFASPGEENYCSYTVSDATENNPDGTAEKDGINALLQGIVYGINYNPDGLQFTVIDDNGDGIGAYSASDDLGYTVSEGDSVWLRGSIGQFRGLTQIYLEEVLFLEPSVIEEPTVVTSLDESTESQLVTIENVQIMDTDEWTSNPFGFNVTVTNGTDMFNIRIDDAVLDIIDKTYPTGTFNITGIGGQFDSSAPFDEGYQLLPRYMSDIDPFVPFVNTYPPTTIGDVTTNDNDGVANSIDDFVTLEGVVYGINLRATGLEFTIIDELGDGIAVFSPSEDFDYLVNEGDKIQVKGQIAQFNGLTEIIPDSLFFLENSSISSPTQVSELNESTESQYILIDSELSLTDPADWKGDGTTFIVTGTNGTDEYEIVIDNDSELSTVIFDADFIIVQGIGSQRDVNAPFDEGYRIIPNFEGDVTFLTKTIDINGLKLNIYPNPTANIINVDFEGNISKIEIYNQNGQLMNTSSENQVNISDLGSAIYQMKIFTDQGIVNKTFIKM